VVLVENIIEGMENQEKHGVWIFIGHPCSLFSCQAFIQGLEESTDLVCIASCTGKYYGSLTKVQRRASRRFFFIQFIVRGYIPGEALCEEVKLKTLVHVETEPHVDEPPGTPQVADGLAEQEFLGYLVKEVVSRAKQVLAEGKSATIG